MMEAIGMLVMPEFFTYRSLQRMQVAVKVWQSSEAVHCLGIVDTGMLSRGSQIRVSPEFSS